MPKKITQRDLTAYLLLKKQSDDLAANLKAAEKELQTALDSGATVEDGVLRCFTKTWERRSVAWKEICERELGVEYVSRVFNATRPETYSKVVVESV